MARKSNAFRIPRPAVVDVAIIEPAHPETELIRTSRSFHDVVANDDGTVTVSTYKLSHNWTTTREEFEGMRANWKNTRSYGER